MARDVGINRLPGVKLPTLRSRRRPPKRTERSRTSPTSPDRHTVVAMAAMRPTVHGRPAWLKMALAVGIGAAAAAALVLGSQLLRGQSNTPDVVPNPVVNLTRIPEHGAVL